MKPEVKEILETLAAARAVLPVSLQSIPLGTLRVDSLLHKPVLQFFSGGGQAWIVLEETDLPAFDPYL